jgi:site-specific DNA-adenine methylase
MSDIYFDIQLKAPFPYFGGKGMIADVIWSYLGDVKQYIEPCVGSGAVLLKRPQTQHEKIYEIVNDSDGLLTNVWRAIKFAPDEVAWWCDWPVNHADLMARKKRLIENEQMLLSKLVDDDMFYDAKLAGYWVWAASCWIGSGLTRPNAIPNLVRDTGIQSKIPYLNRDRGIQSQIPHLTGDQGIQSKIPQLGHNRGVIAVTGNEVYDWLRYLSARLRRVKIVCGDWTRVCGGTWQAANSPVGMFFDPPYATEGRDKAIYHKESLTVAKDIEKWALVRGTDKRYRIVVAGYDDEHASLIEAGWRVHAWSAQGGYGGGDTRGDVNRHRERLYISPHCLYPGNDQPKQAALFDS